jgi:hypothetical protein
LKRKIQLYALDADSNMTDVVCRLLAVDLGITIELPEPIRTTRFGGGPPKYRRSTGK